LKRVGERRSEEQCQIGIRRIVASHPHNLRRDAVPMHEFDEVTIFGDNYGRSLLRVAMDGQVIGVAQAEVSNVASLDLEEIVQESCQCRRQLGIDYELHATSRA
jgi:hypothetical protein